MYRYAAIFGLLFLSACFLHKKTPKKAADENEEPPAVVTKKKPQREPRPVKPKKPMPFAYGSTREMILPQTADRNEMMVAEFNKPQGHLVVYQYSRFGKAAYKGSKYYLYFMNDTLIRKSGEEDLREGANEAVDDYYNNKDDE